MEKVILYILIFVCFLLSNHFHFYQVADKFEISENQKAHILSFRNTIILSSAGLVLNYLYFTGNRIDTNVAVIAVLYFSSYLMSDIIIGRKEYPTYMTSLMGYTHHFIYLFTNIASIYFNFAPLYMMHMIEEIPTVYLTMGKLMPSYRSKALYSGLFILTRIIYHACILYLLWDNKIVRYLSIMPLILHVWWGYKSLSFLRKPTEKS